MGRGEEPIRGCPREQVTPDVFYALDAASDLEHGVGWPSGGGWLDEMAVLVQGVRYSRSLREIAKARVICPTK
jgi:hypothetical protein